MVVLLMMVLFLTLATTSGASVFYVSVDGIDDSTCVNGGQSCANLTLVLDHIRYLSNTEVYIQPGQYELFPTVRLAFEEVQNAVLARDGEGTVDISCQGIKSGLSFHNCTNISIIGLSFAGCGMEHNSTTLNFTNFDTFTYFFASLYFEGCFDTNLSSVSVSYSLGIAVQFYYSPNVSIINSNFTNNNGRDIIESGSDNIASGGVYIEFPYCLPGEFCTDTNIPKEYASNSQYYISGCSFTNNLAKSTLDDPRRYVLPIHYYHVAFGQGGGLSVFFKGNASDCTVIVEDCTFTNNAALYGGGAYFDMQDDSYNNHVAIKGESIFTDNTATHAGGGVYFSFTFTTDASKVEKCSYSIINATFNNNTASYGGGLYYLTTPQGFREFLLINSFKISDCKLTKNEAQSGAGLYLIAFRGLHSEYVEAVNISNTVFEQNCLRILDQYEGKRLCYGALYTDKVSVTFKNSLLFQDNVGTALVAINAVTSIADNTSATFSGNTGVSGGAIAFFSSTVLVLHENTSVYFFNNTASNLGGAIYVENIGQLSIPNSCFLRYYNFRIQPKSWNTEFIFSGNMASNSVNAIYSSSITSCILGRGFGIPKESEIYDVFCWNNGTALWEYDGSTKKGNCMKQIKTGAKLLKTPFDVSNRLRVIPGKRTYMSISSIDDQEKNVTSNLILHATSTSPKVSIDKDFSYISDNEIILYQHFNETVNVSVILDTMTSDSLLQKELYVQFLECPPGLTLNKQSGKCQCNGDFAKQVHCHNSTYSSSLVRGYWIGKYPDGTPVVGHCKNCEYYANNTGRLHLGDEYANLNTLLCGPYKEGVLCSKCSNNYSPGINSNDFCCVKCTTKKDVVTGAFVFLLLDIVCPLILLVVIFLSDVPLTSGLLHGPILFGQMITTVISLDGDDIIAYESIFKGAKIAEKVYITVYDISNTNFFTSFQNFCISQKLSYASIITLQYLTGILPMAFVAFVAIVYYCNEKGWKICLNIRKPKCMNKTWTSHFKNSPNALAMFILLSYTKIAVITGYLLTPVHLWAANETTSDHYKQVMYLDGTIEYSLNPHKDYIKYFLIAFFVGVPILIAVPLFLFLFRSSDPEKKGGFFNHLIHQFQKDFRESASDSDDDPRKKSFVHPGRVLNFECTFSAAKEYCTCRLLRTRCCLIPLYMKWSRYDFRWLSGGLFILRLCLILPYMLAWSVVIQYILQLTFCVIAGVAIITIHPYKRNKKTCGLYKHVDPNTVEAGSLLLLALLIALSMYQYVYTVADIALSKWAYVLQSILVWVPFVWFVIAYVCLLYERYFKKRNGYKNIK